MARVGEGTTADAMRRFLLDEARDKGFCAVGIAAADGATEAGARLITAIGDGHMVFATPYEGDFTLIGSSEEAFEGVTITVEGHTDSDGDAIANQILSQQRAEAVRAALAERGVGAATITAEGFGEDRPVLVNGVEDKDASRRVEFRIETTG